MKRIIFVLSALILLFCLTFSAFAADLPAVDPDEVIEFDEPYYVEPTEGKVYSNCSIDDDFAPDQVIVLLTHDESMKQLQSDDLPKVFAQLDLDSVVERTNAYTQRIRDERAGYVEEYLKSLDTTWISEQRKSKAEQMANTRIDMLYRYYHKCYVLTLRVKDKQAVLDAIKYLEQSEIIYAAEPDYIVHKNLDGINGDADKDGDLTILDATHIQLYKAELIDESEIDLIVSDYDRDGSVTILDATGIQRSLADL